MSALHTTLYRELRRSSQRVASLSRPANARLVNQHYARIAERCGIKPENFVSPAASMIAKAFRTVEHTSSSIDTAFSALRGMGELESWLRLNRELDVAPSAEAGSVVVGLALGGGSSSADAISSQLDELAAQVRRSEHMRRVEEAGTSRLHRLAAINATLFPPEDDSQGFRGDYTDIVMSSDLGAVMS